MIILELEKDQWGNPMLYVECDEWGTIDRAEVWSDLFDIYMDCTEWVKNSDYWKEKIRVEFDNRPPPPVRDEFDHDLTA